MDIPVRVTVDINADELVDSLMESPCDLTAFVLRLDEKISDERWTLKLISELCSILHKEYEDTMSRYTERLLEANFPTTPEGERRPVWWYVPSKTDIDEMTERETSMRQMLKILSTLSDGS